MKEAFNQQTKSHGDIHRSSRRPNSNPVPVSGGSFHSPEPIKSSNGSNGNNPAASSPNGAPGGGGPGLASAQPAPAADPDSSSGGRAVNTSQTAQSGSVLGDNEKQDVNKKEKKPVMQRFWYTSKAIVLSSKINVLLVFVPVGIAVAQIHSMPPAVIFAMNAVAIVPLAGLLSFATESVAHRLGDSLGALLNVTFGNAVELIIL
jgi:Ca2+:H+ antiporter